MTRSIIIISLLAAIACATKPGPFQRTAVVWRDDDRHPIDKPADYVAYLYWDGMDQTLFAPLSRTLAIEVAPPARNVNAWSEVPSSSWFTNRVGQFDIPLERMVRGPCAEDEQINMDGPWIAKSGKVDGGTPGFVIQDPKTKKRYLLKFDDPAQPERQTAADVVGSKIYWAWGMNAPCNYIVNFDPAIIKLADDASKTNALGKKVPLTKDDLEKAMKGAPHGPNGTLRGTVSQFVEGVPIGAWTYEGVRKDDFNDVVPHQDRRDVRGSNLLAAWINHYDSRDQNTLATFHEVEGGKGYVTHWMIDFGDGLGALFPLDDMSRRLGYSYYFDFSDIAGDLLTLGFRSRPWDQVQQEQGAELFGYYDVGHFSPRDWKPGYPNIAFSRMDDRDGYWAAQIIGRFSDEAIARIVDQAQFTNPEHARLLTQILIGRRDRIVHDYVYPMTSLERPRVRYDKLCFEDAVVVGKYAPAATAVYEMSAHAEGEDSKEWQRFDVDNSGHGCVGLTGASVIAARVTRKPGEDPAREIVFHLAQGDQGYELIGIEH